MARSQAITPRDVIDATREAFAAYRGLGRELIDDLILEVEVLRAENARLTDDPLAGRPGLRTEGPETNTLARELGQLAKRRRLSGCVLISFYDGCVGVNSSGEPARFGREMEQLGNRILAAIDDGKFDPAAD